jgi:hypothetical protein
MLLVVSWSLLAAGAYAESLWIFGTNLQKSDVECELTFTVTVNEPGAYEAGLQAQGEAAQDYAVVLELQPETGAAPVTTRFSFAGLDCG